MSGHANITVATVFLLISFTFSTLAATLSDYRERIETAQSHADELIQDLDENNKVYERETIGEITKSIPATEKIEWPGGSIETDNAWLKTLLADFGAEGDDAARASILMEISERLSAINLSVKELEDAAATAATKDQDKQKLGEILRREEYQKPKPAEQGLFQKWLYDFLNWIAKMFPRAPAASEASSGLASLSFVLQILIYALVIGLTGFFGYKFAPFIFVRFGWKTSSEKHDRVILGERIAGSESALDLFSEAERLALEGNLRAAIRKGYIALLCDLSDRKIVRLGRHKTNRDYLRDVRKDGRLFENMSGLTQTFERNWYGLRTAEQADWDDFRTLYSQTIAGVQSRAV